MRNSILILIFIFINSIIISPAQITFQKTYGGAATDIGQFVQQTSDGGYILTGHTDMGAGVVNVYVVRTDSYGDTLWTKTFGGSNIDVGYSVQQTTDGGFVIVGFTYSFGTGGYRDVYLIRLDSAGNLLWSKTFGETDQEEGHSVQQTTDGGFIMTGWIGGSIYLIKCDSTGNFLWTKAFSNNYLGFGHSIQQTSDGGYIMTGHTQYIGPADIYLIKTDSNGDTLWTKAFGGANDDKAFSVKQTMDGGYIVTGSTNNFGAGNNDVYLIKTDGNGEILWSKCYGGTDDDQGNSVRQTADGGFIIAGSTKFPGSNNNNIYLIRTDANGDTLWTRTFGETNDAFWRNSVQQTTDGGFIIGGHTYTGSGDIDAYLIKTDANGNSGCNEVNSLTIVTSVPPQVAVAPSYVYSPVIAETTPATLIGRGGFVCTFCSSVGISENPGTSHSIRITPNPSTGEFIVSFDNAISNGTIEISNMLGEKVFSEAVLNETSKAIHLPGLSSGLYFVNVFDGENLYNGKALIKQFAR